METKMKRLFGTAGIRGHYPDEINPKLIINVSSGVANYFQAKKAVIGGDCRLTTPILKLSAAIGLMSQGVDVIDINLTPLPVLAWSVREFGADIGLYITASHNPPEDNGVKVFKQNGVELFEREEIEIEKLINERKLVAIANWKDTGTYMTETNVIEHYINELHNLAIVTAPKIIPKVLIDCANGPASLITPKVLTSMGAKVVSINSHIDGRFSGRSPEPRPDTLEPFTKLAQKIGVDIFLAHDGDGDRLAVVDPQRGFIKQDRLIAFFAKRYLNEKKGTIVVSIDCGYAVREVVEEMGGKLVVTKLGKTHEKLVQLSDSLMAAEPWKLIDPSWGLWTDGIYQAVMITKIMMKEGLKLYDLLKTVPDYPQARCAIRVPKGVKEKLYDYLTQYILRKMPKPKEVLTIDGMRVNEENYWILIRKSGTESKVRIYCEAKTAKELKDLVTDLLIAAKRYLRKIDVEKFEIEKAIM